MKDTYSKVYAYLRKSPEVTLEELKAAFPDAPEALLNEQHQDWQWQKSPERAASKKRNWANAMLRKEVDGVMGKLSDSSRQLVYNHLPTTELLDVIQQRLERMRDVEREVRQATAFDTERQATGDSKTYSFSLVIEEYEAFRQACDNAGVSVRQGLHAAMKAFTDQFGESADWV